MKKHSKNAYHKLLSSATLSNQSVSVCNIDHNPTPAHFFSYNIAKLGAERKIWNIRLDRKNFPVTAVSCAMFGLEQFYRDPILGVHLEKVSKVSISIMTEGPRLRIWPLSHIVRICIKFHCENWYRKIMTTSMQLTLYFTSYVVHMAFLDWR